MLKRIKSQFWRLGWLLNNYRQIKPGVELIPNVFHGPITYMTDSIVTSNNCDFMQEARFKAAYNAGKATMPHILSDLMPWRIYIVCALADMVKGLPGDFVECGVSTGVFSRSVMEYVDFPSINKVFYLMDTYDGLVPGQITKEEENAGIGGYLQNYKNNYAQVMETFKNLPARIIKGAIPGTLDQCEAKEVCYLSIDMNVVEPEIAAANYFWDKMVKGGVIILDDYGFPMHIEQKKAFDQWSREKGVGVLSLPTGQGIIFKP